WELLDFGESRAFAVADHQIAHVYVKRREDRDRVAESLRAMNGVERVLDDAGKAEFGLDHERAGDLVAVAERDAWFTYYYWLDDARAPDFARTVDIHRKPGYDPAELFFDPARPLVKLRAAWALARKALGFRYLMDVISLDPTIVRGTHGRLRQPERLDQMADACLGPWLAGNEAEQPEPPRIGDRLERGREGLGVVPAETGPQQRGTAVRPFPLNRHTSILTQVDTVCKEYR